MKQLKEVWRCTTDNTEAGEILIIQLQNMREHHRNKQREIPVHTEVQQA